MTNPTASLRRLGGYLIAFITLTTGVASAGPPPEADRPMITGPVRVYGNQHIRTYIIRREIPLRPGDPFDRAALEAAARRIRHLPGVDYSDVAVYVSPTDSLLTVSVSITEKNPIEGKFRFDRGRENDMGVGLTMTHYNLRGRSERLRSSFLMMSGQQYELDWENPWLGTGKRVGVGVRGFFEDYDYVYNDLGEPFAGSDIQRIGGEASVFWTRGGPSRLFLAGGFESVDGGVDEMTLADGRDNYMTVTLGAVLDGRDGSRFPWTGAYLETVAKQIGPGSSTFDIFKGTVDARAFLPLLDRVVLAGHSRFVYHDAGAVPAYMREHIGGIKTLRGYDYGSFNGTNSLVGGVELRIPANFSRRDPMEDLLLGVALHGFVDTGAAWERGADIDQDLFHTTYGLGFTLMNRNFAPIRFDWGWHKNSDVDFSFDVGLMF
jgi:outer membrane protein insertion porin family